MLLIELSHRWGGLYGRCIHLHSTHISGADSLHIARHDYFLLVPFLKVYPDKAILSRQREKENQRMTHHQKLKVAKLLSLCVCRRHKCRLSHCVTEAILSDQLFGLLCLRQLSSEGHFVDHIS